MLPTGRLSFFECFVSPVQELLKPLQLACDSKSAKLVSHALSTAQKMLANGVMSAMGAAAVVNMLSKVRGWQAALGSEAAG